MLLLLCLFIKIKYFTNFSLFTISILVYASKYRRSHDLTASKPLTVISFSSHNPKPIIKSIFFSPFSSLLILRKKMKCISKSLKSFLLLHLTTFDLSRLDDGSKL